MQNIIDIKNPHKQMTNATNILGILAPLGVSQITVATASVIVKAESIPSENNTNPKRIAQKFYPDPKEVIAVG